nr:hypothetical protein CR513_22150 [Ipomoea batatas]
MTSRAKSSKLNSPNSSAMCFSNPGEWNEKSKSKPKESKSTSGRLSNAVKPSKRRTDVGDKATSFPLTSLFSGISFVLTSLFAEVSFVLTSPLGWLSDGVTSSKRKTDVGDRAALTSLQQHSRPVVHGGGFFRRVEGPEPYPFPAGRVAYLSRPTPPRPLTHASKLLPPAYVTFRRPQPPIQPSLLPNLNRRSRLHPSRRNEADLRHVSLHSPPDPLLLIIIGIRSIAVGNHNPDFPADPRRRLADLSNRLLTSDPVLGELHRSS